MARPAGLEPAALSLEGWGRDSANDCNEDTCGCEEGPVTPTVTPESRKAVLRALLEELDRDTLLDLLGDLLSTRAKERQP